MNVKKKFFFEGGMVFWFLDCFTLRVRNDEASRSAALQGA
jgi:hypothetical protein